MLQASLIVANRPGMTGTVPEFGPMTQSCPGLPDLRGANFRYVDLAVTKINDTV